jgi:hypothetical protein
LVERDVPNVNVEGSNPFARFQPFANPIARSPLASFGIFRHPFVE